MRFNNCNGISPSLCRLVTKTSTFRAQYEGGGGKEFMQAEK